MPHTSGLPFHGSVPLSAHTSRLGAEDAKDRAPSQLLRMIAVYMDAPDGVTDHEMAAKLGIPNTSVCARRGDLLKQALVYAEGTRLGPNGIRNAVWRFRK